MRFNREQGFSLIELMIAMLLSTTLIAMVMSVFLNSVNNKQIRDAIAGIQENTRFASHFFSRDFRSLGFFGCLEGGEPAINILSSAGPIANQLNTTQGSLLATDGAIAGAANSALYAADKIEIITLLDTSYPLAVDLASMAADINIAAADFAVGDEFLIGDCDRADLVRVSTVTGNNYGHSTAQNSSNSVSYPYNSNAQIYPIVKISYTVLDNAAGVSSLYRQVNDEVAVELISPVQNMQILYGLSNSDGELTGYMPESAIDAADFDDVISVRISLLLSSSTEVLAAPEQYNFNGASNVVPTDNIMRKTYTATYTLRNRIN